MIKRVCHVASNHNPKDGRIFERECISLTQRYEVYLIVPNTKDEIINGVHILGVELPESRIKRPLKLGRVYKKMIDVDADVYHFHDPELIHLGLKIRKKGKKVIFDSHEDFPAHIKAKYYIPKILRAPISFLWDRYERIAFKHYNAIVSVTPDIVNRLKKINESTYMLTNYPVFEEKNDTRLWERRIAFAGLITQTWNLHHLLEAISKIDDVIFELAGRPAGSCMDELKVMPGWDKVNYHGVINHDSVFEMLNKCSLGVALESYDNPNAGGRKGSIGVTKMFEYMMVGIPVIATDLDNWVPIVEGNDCGYCVNPTDVKQIKEKIEYLLNNKEEAKRLGDNGRKAIKEKYCWQAQEKTLFEMYEKVLAD